MTLISLDQHKAAEQKRWLLQVDRLLMEHFSIRHTDLGWSPQDVAREFATGQQPMEVIMRIGNKTDVIWTG